MPKKSKHPGFRAHSWRTARGEVKTAYYIDNRDGSVEQGGPKEVALGTDYEQAIARWRDIKQLKPLDAGTLKEAFDRWELEALPAYRRVTRRDYGLALTQLRAVFEPGRWADIDMPVLVRYLDERKAKRRSNLELSVLSVIWNWSILKGLTKLPFPAAGMARSKWKNKEHAREVDVTPELFNAIYAEADQVLRDGMDIASATGLRLTDVVSAGLPSDGILRGKASKTAKRFALDLNTSPALAGYMARRSTYRVAHLLLLSTPTRAVTWRMLNDRWVAARRKAANRAENRAIAKQLRGLILRDMRKFAAQQSPSLDDAADLLQHDDRRLTRDHYRPGATPRKTAR